MHERPIPRIGGLAIFIGFLLSASIFSNNIALLSGALVIASIGIVDDVYRISAYQKLVFQIIAAAVVMRTAELATAYLPWLLISGTVAGVCIGIASGLLIKRLRDKI